VTDYPYAGCCPHTFNAHDRTHCTACDCTRPPVQVGTAKTSDAPTPSDSTEWTDLRACGVCHALVLDDSRVAHLDWHETTLRTLDHLLEMTAALSRGNKHTMKESQ
jgi:hypothetical protein